MLINIIYDYIIYDVIHIVDLRHGPKGPDHSLMCIYIGPLWGGPLVKGAQLPYAVTPFWHSRHFGIAVWTWIQVGFHTAIPKCQISP